MIWSQIIIGLYKGPEEWKPPLKPYWTDYARHWIYIKEKYKLDYAPEELRALGEMLETEYACSFYY